MSEGVFNLATRRTYICQPFGVACYELRPTDGGWADHHGVVKTIEEAEAWVRGDVAVVPLRVFGDVGIAAGVRLP